MFRANLADLQEDLSLTWVSRERLEAGLGLWEYAGEVDHEREGKEELSGDDGIRAPDVRDAPDGGGQRPGSAPDAASTVRAVDGGEPREVADVAGSRPELEPEDLSDPETPAPEVSVEPSVAGEPDTEGAGVLPDAARQEPEPEPTEERAESSSVSEDSPDNDGDFLSWLQTDGRTVEEVASHPEFLEEVSASRLEPAENLVLDAQAFEQQAYVGDKGKVRNNLAAIRLIKALESQSAKPHRIPIAWQETLSRFVGWGGLPQMFRDSSGEFGQGFGKLGEDLEALLSPEEYQMARRTTLDAHYTAMGVVDGIWNTLASSALVSRDDLMILEPSVGSGVFLGRIPERFRDDAVVMGCEVDGVTAAIASWCHGRATIHQQTYESFPVLRDTATGEDANRHGFDLVVGNPPFGDQKVFDRVHPEWSAQAPNIHSYFFEKSLYQLRPGGMMAMVVSRYLLDSSTQEQEDWRKSFALRAELLGAVRLPRTAFLKNAGTQVMTDVLLFARRAEPLAENIEDLQDADYPDWVFSVEDMAHTEDGRPIPGSRYYRTHPEAILGKVDLIRGMYQANEPAVLPDERSDTQEILSHAISDTLTKSFVERLLQVDVPPFPPLPSLDRNLFLEADAPQSRLLRNMQDAARWHGENSWFVFDDDQGVRHLALRKTSHYFGAELAAMACPPNLSIMPGNSPSNRAKENVGEEDNDGLPDSGMTLQASRIRRIMGMCEVRDALKSLLDLQVSLQATDTEVEEKREQLNQTYDAFVKKHGLLHRRINARLFALDPAAGSLRALEKDYEPEVSAAVARRTGMSRAPEKAEKADIFRERTMFPSEAPAMAGTPVDALRISLSLRQSVDKEYLLDLLRGGWFPSDLDNETAWQRVREDLGDSVLLDPETGELALRDLVLSGRIEDRIRLARNRQETTVPETAEHAEWEKTITALEGVIPARIPFSRISFRMRTPWVPSPVREEFFQEAFESDIHAHYMENSGKWVVQSRSAGSQDLRWSSGSRTGKVDSRLILDTLLNDKPPVVRYTDRNGNILVDEGDSELLRSRCEDLRKEWERWVSAHPEAQDTLESAYNDRFNGEVLPRYDGSHLDLPGMSGAISLRPQQKNVIWRGLAGNNLIMDHAVGAGKTFAGIAYVMEMRRTGRAKKPLIPVLSHLVEQWEEAFLTLYPNARVLVAREGDRSKKSRQEFLARAAFGDWDAVIVPHSLFSRIPADPEDEFRYLQSEIDLYVESMEQYKEIGDGRSVKQMERKIATFRSRLEKKMARQKADTGLLHMGNVGFDLLVVDEVQEFKNLSFNTNLKNVSGMGNPEGSARAMDLYMKVKGINRIRGREDGVAFLTGTLLSNTLAEMYIWQRYLDESMLEDLGLRTFDAWKDTFASVIREFGFTLTGEYKERAYLGRFENWPELLRLLNRFKDSVTIADVQRMMEEAGMGNLPIPRVAGGAPEIISVQPTLTQQDLIGREVGETPGGLPVYNEGSILYRLDHLPRRPKKGEDNILSLASELMKVGLDARALTKMQNADGEENGQKLISAANRMFSIYQDWMEDRGTQLVFLDFSTPKSGKGPQGKDRKALEAMDALQVLEETQQRRDLTEEEASDRDAYEEILESYSSAELEDLRDVGDRQVWTAYAELRDMLVRKGVPAEEIVFIHDVADDKKQDLFSKVRSGRVRFLVGSSSKMGAGMNVQDRLVGMHHLDAPYRPLDLEQRNGRGIRQGNKLLEKYGEEKFAVHVCYYVTESSGDAGRWQILEFKKQFIDQSRAPLDAASELRSLEDPGAQAFDPAKVKAEASGSQVLIDRVRIAQMCKQESLDVAGRKSVLADVQRQERTVRQRLESGNRWESALETMKDPTEAWMKEYRKWQNRSGARGDAEDVPGEEIAQGNLEDAGVPDKKPKKESRKDKEFQVFFPADDGGWKKESLPVREIGERFHRHLVDALRSEIQSDESGKPVWENRCSDALLDRRWFRLESPSGQDLGEIKIGDWRKEKFDDRAVTLIFHWHLPESLAREKEVSGDVTNLLYKDSVLRLDFWAPEVLRPELALANNREAEQAEQKAQYTRIGKSLCSAPGNILSALEEVGYLLRREKEKMSSIQKEIARLADLQPELEKREEALTQKEGVLADLEKALRCGVRKYEKVDDRIAALQTIVAVAAKPETDGKLETEEEGGQPGALSVQNQSAEWKLDTLLSIRESLSRWAEHREKALLAFAGGELFVPDADGFLEDPAEAPEKREEDGLFAVAQ
ncbi:N-6 DNA methylase [Acidithiobacillus sp. IBUN Pt1247-S3]|uniref:Eco57I restriction-modification methylase domain-containing protein n=1 Tax=Acidithiobacillus sp. IBUN Pt1247-S3 TaxID=3166642 RepID=UPI0034E4BB3C